MRLPAVAALIGAGAALAAGGALLRWASADINDELRGAISAAATGAQAAPALLPIAAAAIAALGAILASRGILRRIVGVLLTILGVAGCWIGASGLVRQPVDVLLAQSGTAGTATITVHPVGPIVAVVGGLFLIAAGLPVLAGRIPARALSARYDRRSAAAGSADPALLMWKELDEQRDPTLEPERQPGHDRLTRPPGGGEPGGKSGP